MEQKETKIMEQLEQSGKALREAKCEFYKLCSETEYVKGSTIRAAYDRIEEQQSEFYRLDSELTEIENAY